MNDNSVSSFLESACQAFHHPEFIHPDPLELVLLAHEEDRELAAFIASAYAMGRVGLILRVLERIFISLGMHEGGMKQRLIHSCDADLERISRGISYRFFKPVDLKNLLAALRDVLADHGSMESFFSTDQVSSPPPDSRRLLEWYRESPVMKGLGKLHRDLHARGHDLNPMFFSDPSGNGACKRFHLFMRWMVRKDDIDPGGWTRITPAELWIPLDTHVLRHSRRLSLTSRTQADAKAVAEIGAGLRRLLPTDPCRYDFALSRMGINPGASERENELYALEQAVEGKIGNTEFGP